MEIETAPENAFAQEDACLKDEMKFHALHAAINLLIINVTVWK
jgi:hypothetical protein